MLDYFILELKKPVTRKNIKRKRYNSQGLSLSINFARSCGKRPWICREPNQLRAFTSA